MLEIMNVLIFILGGKYTGVYCLTNKYVNN